MRNREFVFTPKIEYKLVAERSEANQNSLTFPTWCSILELVRTHFSEKIPPRKFGKAAEPHRSKPQKNPEKNIGSNHILILGEENFLIIMNKSKLLAISIFSLLIPSFAFASTGGAAFLVIMALIFIVVLVGLFIPVLAAYLLRKRSNPFLVAIDIIISVILVLLIDIFVPIYDIFEMFNFLTTAFFVLVFILFISYFVAKRKGGEISAIKKVCFHGLSTAILIIFLTTSYAFLAEPLYYKSGCSINIIFNTYSDPTNNFNRLSECKYTSNNYTFCRVLGTTIKDLFCPSLTK